MSLASGTHLGPYTVLGPLGAGGMGEVFRARDGKLQRDVALKVLPESVAGDHDRLARFEREAHLLAALNHPNIAGIHGVVEDGGVTALVLELVEGPTLAERLDEGRVPLDEALPIARQVADALAAAHDAGIIHRDLKPANIKLRPDGTVKVLDFGLAKASAGSALSGADQTHSPTMAQSGTAAGVILGTAAYMAPEQARGRPVDKRADIWAFGVVVWEMLTGRQLFLGETLSDTLAAVLTREIVWADLPRSTPPGLVDLLHRCLERDPKRRLRDIGDARLEDTSQPVGPAERSVAAIALRWLGLALSAVALVAAGVLVGRGARSAVAPQNAETRFTVSAPGASAAAVSPDGSAIVFASNGPLQVRELNNAALRPLEGTDGAVKPFWSPDSRSIAFGRAGRLWRVGASGGPPTLICDLPSGAWDYDAGGAWLPDDSIVFSNGGSNLLRVKAAGGDAVPYVAPTDPGELHFHAAHALPNGRGVIYVVHRDVGADTIELAVDGTRTMLYRAPDQTIRDPVYSPTGHILFDRSPANEGIWALPFALDRLEVTGEPYLVEAGARAPSASLTGTFVYLSRADVAPARLRWRARDGTWGGEIGAPGIYEPFPELSPDGTRVAICERVDGVWGLTLVDVARQTRQRITSEGRPSMPTWLPDGKSLIYAVGSTAVTNLRRITADGTRTEDLGGGGRPASDGSHVFFERFQANDFDVLFAPLGRPGGATPFTPPGRADVSPRPSPDGRLVAYMSMPSLVVGGPEVMLRRFPPSDASWQVSSGGGTWPRWSRDGSRLYYITAEGIVEVTLAARDGTIALSPPRQLFTHKTPLTATGPDGFDVAPDGRFLVLDRPGPAADPPVHVALNWTPRQARAR